MIIQATFKKFDPAAKEDISELVFVGNTEWSNAEDLRQEEPISAPNLMTLEHNYSVLDGTMDEFPDDTSDIDEWGFWSRELSNSSGEFSDSLRLDISFKSPHTSDGLTLHFYNHTNDYAATATIIWWDDFSDIAVEHVELAGTTAVIEKQVENYKAITIDFTDANTNNPYRYIKLRGIDFGLTYTFDDRMIERCQILEETNPISDIVSTNKLNISVRPNNDVFSIVSEDSKANTFMQYQTLKVTGDGKEFGTFFLNTYKDDKSNGKVLTLEAFDAVWAMDKNTFNGGMYDNYSAADIINELFEIVFPVGQIVPIIDDAFSSATISGHIPICTCREALQSICFAIGATVDTARQGDVWLYPKDTEQQYAVTKDTIYTGTNINANNAYSGVEVVAFGYSLSAETEELYKGVLPAGQSRIEFSAPADNISVNNGNIVEQHVNYIIVDLPSESEVIVSGNPYVEIKTMYSLGDAENDVCRADGCKLVNVNNAAVIAQRIYDYLHQKVSIEQDVMLGNLEVGYITQTETYGNPIIGTIEKLDINMRGNRAKMLVVGDTTNGD
jgi:hypothetical protein